MLELFDKDFRKIAILQNAFNMSEELRINSINYFNFSLPETDHKNELCKPFNYIRYNNGQLYRIMNTVNDISEQGIQQYRCEHVLALLMDKIMFSLNSIVIGGIGMYTRKVIQYVLDQQLVKNWVLGDCDFNRQFEYGWTQENLLTALFSIPTPFTESYMWTFNTNIYPFQLNLKLINMDINPQMYIRFRKNAIRLIKTSDPQRICTRLYPLGAGEGINQLNIKDINNGVPFLQSPKSYIDRYGIIERVWADRRYTNAQSLMEATQATLNELQEPYVEYQVDYAVLGKDYFDTAELGKVVQIVGHTKTIITSINKKYDDVEQSTIGISNKPQDIASSIANLADRQRIEMTYSQGATQIFQITQPGTNADTKNGAPLSFYIPSDMLIINKIICRVELSPFRAYSKATLGGGGQTISQSNTTSSGASSVTTTSSGGGQTSGSSSSSTTQSGGGQTSGSSSLTTTQSGGATTSGSSSESTTQDGGSTQGTAVDGGGAVATSEVQVWRPGMSDNTQSDGQHVHTIPSGTLLAIVDSSNKIIDSVAWGSANRHSHMLYNHGHEVNIRPHRHNVNIPEHKHSMAHTHTIGAHDHPMAHTHSVSAHSHNMEHHHSISAHSHGMAHSHNIQHTHQIPDHAHTITPAIYFFGNPSAFDIKINGFIKAHIPNFTTEIDITNMLLNAQNIIPRGQFHKVEIIPNDLAYVAINLSVQGFIQSRGDKTV